MKTIQNILLSGLAKKGNVFKITISDLMKEANMTQIEVCMALNTITMFNNPWNMIKQ